MPDELVTVYDKATGTPVSMHSIDASEAVAMGDYTMVPSSEPTPEQMAQAGAKIRSVNVNLHPEQMSPEARQAVRDQAKAEADAAVASGQTVQEPYGVRRALGAETDPPPAASSASARSSRRTE